MIKLIKTLLATTTLATILASGGCYSHEHKCKELGGKVQSQNVYDEKGNYDHSHYQCVTHNGDITDEWDGK